MTDTLESNDIEEASARTNLKLLRCEVHSDEELSWVCIDKYCDRRVFCQECIVDDLHRHQGFIKLSRAMVDPISAIKKLEGGGFESNTNEGKTIVEKIENFIKREAEKFDKILDAIMMDLVQHFEEIKKKYLVELKSCLEKRQSELGQLEKYRLQYSALCRDLFGRLDCLKQSKLKENLDSLLERFYSDAQMHGCLQSTLESIPLFKEKSEYGPLIKGKPFEEISWRHLVDRDIGSKRWTFHTKDKDGKFVFSNNNMTVKKVLKSEGFCSLCIFGSMAMEKGRHTWFFRLDELDGRSLGIGISEIRSSPFQTIGIGVPPVKNSSNDFLVYSNTGKTDLAKVKGELRFQEGDLYELCLNFIEDSFSIKGSTFEYKATGKFKGCTFRPCIYFSGDAGHQLSLML